MTPTSDHFRGAELAIVRLLKTERSRLMEVHGKITHELKADNSIVTHLDKELERKLVEVLQKYDSSVGFLGEEHGASGNKKKYWLIDPIDGTEAFTRGLSGCRNILTFIADDVPLYALVYRFPTGDLFTAEHGHSTLKNGQPVKLSDRPLNRAWIEFSVNMMKPAGYKMYKTLRPKIAGITTHQDFLAILEGGLEGMVVYKSRGAVWDYAPRSLLIEGAGGRVANFGKDTYNINDTDFVAGTTEIFDEVHKLLSALA